jgi:hypothetical protein
MPAQPDNTPILVSVNDYPAFTAYVTIHAKGTEIVRVSTDYSEVTGGALYDMVRAAREVLKASDHYTRGKAFATMADVLKKFDGIVPDKEEEPPAKKACTDHRWEVYAMGGDTLTERCACGETRTVPRFTQETPPQETKSDTVSLDETGRWNVYPYPPPLPVNVVDVSASPAFHPDPEVVKELMKAYPLERTVGDPEEYKAEQSLLPGRDYTWLKFDVGRPPLFPDEVVSQPESETDRAAGTGGSPVPAPFCGDITPLYECSVCGAKSAVLLTGCVKCLSVGTLERV